jgi:hypothetical protein
MRVYELQLQRNLQLLTPHQLPAPDIHSLTRPRSHGDVLYDRGMNKMAITVCMTIGSLVGSLVPMWFGDANWFDGWSILGTFIGGILGIWLGVKVGRALS